MMVSQLMTGQTGKEVVVKRFNSADDKGYLCNEADRLCQVKKVVKKKKNKLIHHLFSHRWVAIA